MAETPAVGFYTIINGAAGGGRCRARADHVLPRLRRAGLEITPKLTEGPGHATELARLAFEDGFRHFLSVGGDGTTFEVLNGLFPGAEPGEVTLGILPFGTGNSFLRDFGISDAEEATQAVIEGNLRDVDIVRMEHEEGELFYLNLLSVGFSALAGELTNRKFKRFGTGGYVLAVLSGMVDFAKVRLPFSVLNADSSTAVPFGSGPSILVSFCNSQYTGGKMMMAPGADAADGLIDIIDIGTMDRRRFLRAFPKIFAGTHIDLDEVKTGRTAKVVFDRAEPTICMLDGEIRNLTPRTLGVVPGALRLLC